jgi:hypothetical protein
VAFPSDRLAIRAEMLIDGSWTDITERVRGVNGGGIVIERGYRNESGSTFTPAQARFDLNNRDAYFSTKAPESVNYRNLPPGTQVRFSVDDPDGMALELVNGYDGARNVASTADKAVLDITGDIEIRADFKPPAWTSADTDLGGQTIVSKWLTTGSMRSYALTLTNEGKVAFFWTTAGSTILSITSTAAVPFTTARGAVRVLFDVDNGAAGRTATFYTGPDIDGPWAQLGSAVVQAGTTSIHSSTADVYVGALANTRFTGHRTGFEGRIYRVQIYSGLTGTTLRADPNFGAQTAGDDSFSDGLGTPNTWTVPTDLGGITTGTYRFWGEVAELPQRWDSTGTDIFVPVQAADFMRRLTQGENSLDSALYAYLSSRTDLLSYFPLEEETGATRLSNLAPLGEKGRFNDVSFGADAELPASKSVLTFNSAASYATSYGQRRGKGVQDYASFVFHFKLPAVPVSEIQLVSLGFTANGGYRYTLNLDATGWVVRMFNAAGTALDTASVTYGSFMSPDRWTAVRFQTHELGTGFIEMELAWIDIENQQIAGTTAQFSMDPMGMQSTWNFAANAALDGLKLAHVFMGQAPLEMTSQFLQAATAYASERAGTRLLRLAEEAGIDLYVIGDPEDTERMGAQSVATRSQVIEDCVAVDGGLIYSRRDALALGYRTQKSLLNADVTELSYADGQLSNELLPTDDDQILRNDVTVSRPAGGAARAVKETGSRSVEEVGRYSTSYALNAYTDDRVLPLAEYALALGTWDELRYPVVEIEQSRNTFVTNEQLAWAIRTLDVGDVLKLTGLPAWLPPDDVELAFRGVTETLRNRGWTFRWNMQAYGPFRSVSILGATPEGDYNLASASVSVLETSATDTATSFTVNTPGPVALWRTGAVNRAIRLGGEVGTVGTIADSVTDSFTRTVASGWGSTDTGQAWTNAGGTAANFNVAAGVGTVSLSTINASRRLTLPTTYTDSTALARFTISVNPTGDDVETTLMGRYQDGSNYMQASIFWDGDATFADIQIVRRLAGVATTLAVRRAPFTQATSSLTAWLMFQCHGTAYRMKAWIGTRAVAPTRWLLSATDSSFSSGLNGIRGNIQPSYSGGLPVTVTVEDYAVANPQTFSSITRSQNGVIKAQTAGTEVDIDKPFYAGKGVGP